MLCTIIQCTTHTFIFVETFHGKPVPLAWGHTGFPLEHMFQGLGFWLSNELTVCLRKKAL